MSELGRAQICQRAVRNLSSWHCTHRTIQPVMRDPYLFVQLLLIHIIAKLWMNGRYAEHGLECLSKWHLRTLQGDTNQKHTKAYLDGKLLPRERERQSWPSVENTETRAENLCWLWTLHMESATNHCTMDLPGLKWLIAWCWQNCDYHRDRLNDTSESISVSLITLTQVLGGHLKGAAVVNSASLWLLDARTRHALMQGSNVPVQTCLWSTCYSATMMTYLSDEP